MQRSIKPTFRIRRNTMAATSVTGTGTGAAATQKGPGNGRNYWVPQVNPHVVAAGVATLDSSAHTVVVTFGPLPLAAANYAVLVTSETSTTGALYVTKTDTSSKFTSFTVTGTGDGSVSWAIVSAGLGLDVAN